MLKLRKRHASAMTIDVRADSLKIRNLLDDPQLKVVMGDDVTGSLVAPTHLDRSRRAARRQGFGRRLLLRAA